MADERKEPSAGDGAEGRREGPAPQRAPGPPDAKPPEPAATEPKDGEKPAEQDAAGPQFVGTGMFWSLVVGIVVAIVVIVFASQNTQSATVKGFFWEWSSPLFVVILISLILGIVLAEIVGLLYRSRRRRLLAEREELRRLRGKH